MQLLAVPLVSYVLSFLSMSQPGVQAVAIARPQAESTECPAPQPVPRCCVNLTEGPLDLGGLVGIGCVNVAVGGCANKLACCSGNTTQDGLINLDLDCISIL